MAEALIYQDNVVFDDRTQRFAMEEYEGWMYNDTPNILPVRRIALNRGAFRTASKIDGTFELDNARIDANTRRLNAARRAAQPFLGLFYTDLDSRRIWYSGQYQMEDIPETYLDPITTTLGFMPVSDIIQSYPYGTSGDHYYPGSGITSGTAFGIGNLGGTGLKGPPVVVIDLRQAANLGSNPDIEVALSITGATGSPWSIDVTNIRDGGLYIANFNAPPIDIEHHPNLFYETAANAAQIVTATNAAATAAAATIEITLSNFSSTGSDTAYDVYVGREFMRE